MARVIERCGDGREWIRRNLYLFWLQIHEPYQYKDIDDYTIREVYIGNLKLESEKLGGKWFRPSNYNEFKEYIDRQLNKYRDLKYPGVYISQERYRGGFIECRDLYLDIDFDENNPDKSFEAIKTLDGKLSSIGVYILWSLSGNGIHGRLDMLPIYNLYDDQDKLNKFLEDTPRIYSGFARYLENYLENIGYKIVFDKKIYGSRRLIRALYSPHETMEIIEKPLDFRFSLESNKVLSRIEYIEFEGGYLGYIEKPKNFLRLLLEIDELYKGNIEKSIEKPRLKPVRLGGGWRLYNNIKYDSTLEGYGWITRIIDDNIHFEDGRETFIWYVLSKAVINGLIPESKAIEWIRRCIEKYPDPEHSIDYYIKKLHYNMRVKVNPPTWRTLLSESGSRVGEIRHLKENILPVFIEYGLLKPSRPLATARGDRL